MGFYKELLTTDDKAYAIYVPSPFDQKKRLLLAASDVSSRYNQRGPHMYQRILDYIVTVTEKKSGNYMVFFPSYQYMEEVAAIYYERYSEETIPFSLLLQESGMTEVMRDEFLSAFRQERKETLVGFCVIGGIFSEGIDLTGESLIGALIVGTGLSQVNAQDDLLRSYFDEKGKKGYDYAYRYPGINKVFQAAGRVIRTTEDEVWLSYLIIVC